MHYWAHDAVAIPAVVVLSREDHLELVYGFYHSMTEAREVASYLVRHHLLADDIEVEVVAKAEFVHRCSHHYYH